MAKITMRVEGGNFRQGRALREAVMPGLRASVEQAGQAVKAVLQPATPVRSGRLQAGWFVRPAHWETALDRLIVTLGNTQPYLNSVNRRSKRNKGFIERALSAAPPHVQAAVRAGVVQWIPTAWGKDHT